MPARLRAVAAKAGAAFFTAASIGIVAGESRAQLGDIAAIRATAERITASSRALAEAGGPDFQARVLDGVRRSCAARAVVRLDEIAPAEVSGSATGQAAPALLAIDFRNSAPGSPPPLERQFEAVDKDSDFSLGAHGLQLRSGQVRTAFAFELARDEIGTIEIDVATDAGGQMLIGWNEAADAPRLRRNNARVELVGDARVHTYAIDAAATLQRGLAAGASLRRFFLASRNAAPLRIQAFRVLPRAQRYAASLHGAAHESCGGELRRVLFQHPVSTLAFDVDVPQLAPVFEAGLGTTGSSGLLELEVAVSAGDERAVLLKRLVRSAAASDGARTAPWDDVALDLSRWSGKRVRVSLSVRGTPGAVALWSSPLVRTREGDERTLPFIVLLEDALRPDRLSLYGGPVASPAHERIAAGGLVFERAFAQATQTRSSVPSLMTSLMPSSNGTWDFSDALSERYVTLAEMLRSCGFATASFLQNGNAGAYAGLAQGFDVVFDEEKSGDRAGAVLGSGSALDRWIARQRGRPYFAYVHVLDPHGPYDPDPRPELGGAGDGPELLRDRSIDAQWLEKPTAAARRVLYDAEVSSNDRAVAGLLERLDASGDLVRAVVVVIADHGEFLGEHGGLWRHHPPGHLEVARVPFLLRAPGATARRIAEPVALLDLMPTLLDLAGIDASALPMHGTSLAPLLRGAEPSLRAIPADEMILSQGERRASGCGSFVTQDALWLLSCTRDEDFEPGRLLAVRAGEPAPLRRVELSAAQLGVETAPGTLAGPVVEAVARSALSGIQEQGLRAWQSMTSGAAGKIVSEPATAERLHSLGYAQ